MDKVEKKIRKLFEKTLLVNSKHLQLPELGCNSKSDYNYSCSSAVELVRNLSVLRTFIDRDVAMQILQFVRHTTILLHYMYNNHEVLK